MAKNTLDAFSSSDWIAAKHEDQALEADNEYMRPAHYINAVTGKSSKVIVYGLQLDQVTFWGAFQEKIHSLLVRIFRYNTNSENDVMLIITDGYRMYVHND
jgi:hypothetical protein